MRSSRDCGASRSLKSKNRLIMRAAATVAIGAAFAVGAVAPSSARSVLSSHADQTIPVLRVGSTFALGTLDPARTTGGNIALLRGTETLMTYGPNGEVIPNLAGSVKQPSQLMYVFTLRKGIKFWNGNELTAVDVANALNFQRCKACISSRNLTAIRDVKAVGRYTVVITLKRRDASFLWLMATNGSIFEKKFQDEHRDTFGQPGTLLMGTGPWKVDSYDPTRGAELSAHRNYWGGKPHIGRISVRFFRDETSMALAFRAGEIDVAFPGDPRAWAGAAGAKVISSVPSFLMYWFSMNVKKPPWNDIHVRRAVAYALNRAALIQTFGGFATPVSTLIPPFALQRLASQKAVNTLLKSIPSYPFNLTKARAEMAKSAYPNGFTTTTPTVNGFNLPQIHQVIADQLKQIGIDWKFEISPSRQAALFAGPKDDLDSLAWITGWPIPDASFGPGFLLHSRNVAPGRRNMANYTPQVVDDLIEEGVKTYNRSKRLAVYQKLLKRLGVDVPYVPLMLGRANLALSSRFKWEHAPRLPLQLPVQLWIQWPQEIRPR
jgi:peptide/nickel transport system substrate-binding protein